MNRALLLSAFCLSLALLPLAHGRARGSPEDAPIRMAITVDDLPSSTALPAGYGSRRLVSELVAGLRAHRLQNVIGFAIGGGVEADPEGREALQVWTDAGHELANHTYSHRSVDELGRDAYLQDVARMATLLRELALGARGARYFRYPYLEEGRDARDRKLVMQGVRALGYTPARVSMDFSDWAWGDTYTRCLSRGQHDALPRLASAYLRNAGASYAWSVTAARQVLRRPFPQVLLLHANIGTAQNLDALLSQYEQAGVQFVSLAEALRDPVYSAEYDASGGNVLVSAAGKYGRPLPPWQPPPVELLELVCR